MSYAPARDSDGRKQWVVATTSSWGKRSVRLVWAASLAEARLRSGGRAKIRRATPEDINAVTGKSADA